MHWLTYLLWPHNKFLGIEWSVWKVIGWIGNAVFSSRVIVQWYVTEKRGQVVVPPLFWWLSLAGSLILLSYALFYEHDSVFIFAYLFNWIPYIRNLVIHRRHQKSHILCSSCGAKAPPSSKFCNQCGLKLP